MSLTIREAGPDEIEALIPILRQAEETESALRWSLANLSDAEAGQDGPTRAYLGTWEPQRGGHGNWLCVNMSVSSVRGSDRNYPRCSDAVPALLNRVGQPA